MPFRPSSKIRMIQRLDNPFHASERRQRCGKNLITQSAKREFFVNPASAGDPPVHICIVTYSALSTTMRKEKAYTVRNELYNQSRTDNSSL